MYKKSSTSFPFVVFGAGCFWCIEGIFVQIKGVHEIIPGYAGGHKINPSYQEVCTGTTGHAEVIKITYDPKLITFESLLSVFWSMHDSTTVNRQGADIGDQYRSVIFYNNDDEKKIAMTYKKQLNVKKISNNIVTQILPLIHFYEAENYHRNYYANNAEQPYCQYVIRPKIEKFKADFSSQLLKEQ